MSAPRKRSPDLFYIALPVCALVAILGLTSPGALEALARSLTNVVFRGLDWFFVTAMTGFALFSIWLGLGRYGKIKLGRPEDQPEFSIGSWLAMLFAAGMGVGLLFWGVAEPVNHFGSPPLGPGGTADAARDAMTLTIFHWGIHAWGVYCFSGLVLAYFGFRHGGPQLAGTPIRLAFRGRWVAPVAGVADLVAVLAVAFGVAGSTAPGVMQLQAGLHVVAGVPLDSLLVGFVILTLLVISYMSSAVTGLNRGIKWLSDLNIVLAIALMAFLAIAGPTAFILRTFFSTVGDYLSGFVGLSFQLYPYEPTGTWLEKWTLTNFIWWIAWAPFVGVFIARISRGRTIRGFVGAVLLVPTVFSLIWFVTFGGTALHEELFGAGGMERLVREDVTAALFSLFDRLPASALLAGTAIALVFIFLVTSLDSATFVLGMLTSRGTPDPSLSRRIAWGIGIGVLSAALLISGNVHAVRAVSVMGSMPFVLILLLQVVALMRTLRQEPLHDRGDPTPGSSPGERT